MLKSKIESLYELHDCNRICQGDILRDVKFIVIDENEKAIELSYQYIVVLSQDCDLEQGNVLIRKEFDFKNFYKEFNQFLHSVLFLPAFPAEILRSGEHLKLLYEIKAQKINTKAWRLITSNQNPRYHFLPPDQEYQIPELVLDFKAYYTLSYKYFAKKHKDGYLATVNELFRERLSQRYSNYLNRIGLPELPKPES